MKRSTPFLALWVILGILFLVPGDPLQRLGPDLFLALGGAMILSAVTFTVLRVIEIRKARREAVQQGGSDDAV